MEDMEGRADQKRMPGIFPIIAAFERAFGVHENVRNILDTSVSPRRTSSNGL
jgi:hypothetical protein